MAGAALARQAVTAARPLTAMVQTFMTLTAIGLSLPHQGAPTASVEAIQVVARDAAPLAQRIALAEADVHDLDGRIGQLDAMVKPPPAWVDENRNDAGRAAERLARHASGRAPTSR